VTSVRGSANGSLWVAVNDVDQSDVPAEWLSSTLLRRVGSQWSVLWQRSQGDPDGAYIADLLALGDDDLMLAVMTWWGDQLAQLLRDQGDGWSVEYDTPSHRPKALTQLADGTLAAVGTQTGPGPNRGLLLRRMPDGWQASVTNEAEDLAAIWGRAATDLFVGGWPSAVAHFDGTGFDLWPIDADIGRFFALWPGPAGVYVGGSPGMFYLRQEQPNQRLSDGDYAFYDAWWPSPFDGFAGGCWAPDGTCLKAHLVRVADGSIEVVPPPPGEAIASLWATSPCDLWAGTDAGLFHCACAETN
jgi:hypothetical protein